jgi:surface antigen
MLAPIPVAQSSPRLHGAETSVNPFAAGWSGYCTFGVQELLKQRVGYYIAALTGPAGMWNDQARGEWTVVSEAQPRSIVVFEPGVAGAGGVGHVAWVNNVTEHDGQRYIDVTEMNWNGNFDRYTSRSDIPEVSGMSFILIP